MHQTGLSVIDEGLTVSRIILFCACRFPCSRSDSGVVY
jgi:hypothetical protein